jgi:hypothetical protein
MVLGLTSLVLIDAGLVLGVVKPFGRFHRPPIAPS